MRKSGILNINNPVANPFDEVETSELLNLHRKEKQSIVKDIAL